MCPPSPNVTHENKHACKIFLNILEGEAEFMRVVVSDRVRNEFADGEQRKLQH